MGVYEFQGPSVSVESANGGEVMAAGLTWPVKWLISGEVTGDVNVWLSINGGLTWGTLVTSETAAAGETTYTWTVPSLISTECLLSIEAQGNSLWNFDTSYATFEIWDSVAKPLSVTIEAPKGGDILGSGVPYAVMWSVSPKVEEIYVRLSTNEGTTWDTLITHESWRRTGLCTYEWTPSAEVASSKCLISVEARLDGVWAHDANDAVFEVFQVWDTVTYPLVATVEAPTGGEVLDTGSTYKIMWTVTPSAEEVSVRLSTDGGETWGTVVTHESWMRTGLCTYEWTVPDTNVSEQCLISVEVRLGNVATFDTSGATFEIQGPAIVYVSPGGSDANDGRTLSAPKHTVQNALNAVRPGGKVMLLPGEYASTGNYDVVWPNRNNITLKLSSEATGLATMDAQGSGRLFYIGYALNLTIEGITIQNGHCSAVGSSPGVGGGIYLASGSGLWLEDVTIKNCTVEGYGGAVHAAAHTIKVRASNCKFINNKAYHKSPVDYGLGGVGHLGSWEVVNCLFSGNYSEYGGVFEGWQDGLPGSSYWTSTNCTYNNNTAYSDTGYGSIAESVAVWTSFNDIFWGNGAVLFQVDSAIITYTDIQGGYAGTGNISLEPMFISAAEGNYQLLGGSPCIDTASFEGASSPDLAGKSRPRGFGNDMGAYEFQGPSVRILQPNGGEGINADVKYKICWQVSPESVTAVKVRVSTDEGLTWSAPLTTEAWSHSSGVSTYEWSPSGALISTLCLISVEVTGGSSQLWNCDKSNADFSISLSLYPPTNLTSEALPALGPEYVRLYWTPSTSESKQGYYVYRATLESNWEGPINEVLITTGTYEDGTVSLGTDYYYVVKTFGYGVYSSNSNSTSAPRMNMTRVATVDAPTQYIANDGGPHDAVPGATIRFIITYKNFGFAKAKNINIIDKIPPHTDYKMDSATGEAVTEIKFYNGTTWGYVPDGSYVDPLVTNILWLASDMSSGISKVCTYEVVIK
jgi:uncharacterized repeat protein (TIGR01451 family)